MRAICGTCEQSCEVFQASGRTDLICSDCYVSVRTAIHLYQMLSEAELTGRRALELESQFELALHRMFSRIPSAARRAAN
jgi:hypothetical protein